MLISLLRGLSRVVYVLTFVVFAALVWTIIIRMYAGTIPGPVSSFLVTWGNRLLSPFDKIVPPAVFPNNGTFSWTSLLAIVVYVLAGITIGWAIGRVADYFLGIYLHSEGVSPGELEDLAPNRIGGVVYDEETLHASRSAGASYTTPPLPPTVEARQRKK